MIIDCHGHYTTEPQGLKSFREQQVKAVADKTSWKPFSEFKVTDDDIRETIEKNQLKKQQERGTDITIFSPRAAGMGHHIGDFQTSLDWSRASNEMIYRVTELFPKNFIGVAQLPQSPGVDPKSVIPEIERCVNEYGFVGVNLNPDPSGGHWDSPPLTDKVWYPIYEKLCELDVPAMVHVSMSCNPSFHTTGAHYLNADTTAFMQLIMSDLFKDFPKLRLIIPHGGGAVPFHWGRFRGLALQNKRTPIEEMIKNNVFFDTCVYHLPGIELLTKVVPIENILFASEMIGAVQIIDPNTGNYFDDTKRYVDGVSWLTAADKQKIYEDNIKRVYPGVAKRLAKVAWEVIRT